MLTERHRLFWIRATAENKAARTAVLICSIVPHTEVVIEGRAGWGRHKAVDQGEEHVEVVTTEPRKHGVPPLSKERFDVGLGGPCNSRP